MTKTSIEILQQHVAELNALVTRAGEKGTDKATYKRLKQRLADAKEALREEEEAENARQEGR